MCRVLLFSLAVVMMVVGGSTDPPSPPPALACVHKAMMCCNTNLGKTNAPPKPEDWKECFKGPPNPHSCDTQICVGVKMGYAKPDGTFIKDGFMKNVEEISPNSTEYVDLVKKFCVDGDITVYGEKDFCDLKRIQLCSFVQFMKVCDDWKDGDRCKNVEEETAECLKEYP